MKVLSLFDGISCGQLALERADIKVDNYYASEIDKYAIKVTMKNYPNTIQLGDVCNIKGENLPKIDLLIGGSPCHGFSFAGKQLNFDDPRSKLFWEYVRILKEVNPKHFLLENVKMKKEYEKVITEALGVEPIEINSALVSAQNRKRLYWTNIPNVTQPKDRKIDLIDILENKSKINKGTIIGRRINNKGHRDDYNKKIPITQCLEVRQTNTNKSNCLTTVDKDNVLTELSAGRYLNAFEMKEKFRYFTIKEYCRLQNLPDDYTEGISESKAKKCIGNGWTVEVIAHIFKGLK